MDSIDKFIEELSKEESTPTLTNVYGLKNRQGEICRHNLSVYLHKVLTQNSRLMLIGEAPGFHGCRLSGIPFTCEQNFTERTILNIIKGEEDYKIYSETEPEFELSASIVWPLIKGWYDKYHSIPLLWNICPFHPHNAMEVMCNRTPNKKEIERGIKYFLKLKEIFNIEDVWCIGRKSQKALKKDMGIEYPYLRHPAHGGSSIFRESFKEKAQI